MSATDSLREVLGSATEMAANRVSFSNEEHSASLSVDSEISSLALASIAESFDRIADSLERLAAVAEGDR